MGNGKWLAAAIVSAAAAGAVYAGKKITEAAEKLQENMNRSSADHKFFVKKTGRDIALNEGESFKKGSIGVVCGGLNYDMGRCKIEGDAELDIKVYMGGVNCIVPENTKIVIDSQTGKAFSVAVPAQSIDTDKEKNGPILTINASGSFGGVNVRYPYDGEQGENGEETEFDDLEAFDKTQDVRPEGAPDPFALDPYSVVPTDPVDSNILNAKSMESAIGCTATGLLDFDNPSASAEAVISSAPASMEYKREENDEAAEDPVAVSEEVAEDPVG